MMPIALTDALYPDWQRSSSFFYERKFLTIREVVKKMEKAYPTRTPEIVQKFYDAHENIPRILHLYNDLPTKRFPLAQLRHVTIKDCFKEILRKEKIKGYNRAFILNREQKDLRVSCWGVHIRDKDMKACRQKRLTEFLKLADERGCIQNDLSENQSFEVSGMLANSPALRADSRYGNFQFSFPTKDLLAMYQDQHCGGLKPVLRVLGTEVFKQEIVHWILLHNPRCEDFDHLATVDAVGPFSRDGNLMWAPESMTDLFFYNFSNRVLKKKPLAYTDNEQIQTHDAWIWDNVVFAFHLPGRSALRIDKCRLLNNVQACHTIRSMGSANSRFLRHPKNKYITRKSAQALIEHEKRQL